MQPKHNKKLIIKVLVVGAIIAILSYLFHPGVGQLSVMLNGEPVAEPLVRFAAIPTFLLIMMITGVLVALLFESNISAHALASLTLFNRRKYKGTGF